MFCAAAVTLVPVLITLCFAARDTTALRAPVLFAVTEPRDDVVVVAGAGDGVDVRPRKVVDCIVGVRAARADVPPVRSAASAPNPLIKNAIMTIIFFNGNLPAIIMCILS